jgi:Uncharacterised nucleotidyltransferase
VNYEDRYRAGGNAALLEAERFFMGESEVQKTLVRITSKLDELKIPYVVVGGMALVAHGYNRTTVDVDLLVTEDGLRRVHEALDGLGYLPPFQGSKHLRDTGTSVRVEFLVSGGFPGDGKPKPVAFPEPLAAEPIVKDGVRYIGIAKLIELKLASGMTGGVGRLKDLADVVELARSVPLDRSFADRLDPYVRSKFVELIDGLAQDTTDHGSPA